jgi:glycosyltransferase involved in cell wall biosynthesis
MKTIVTYVPHGIDTDMFQPITSTHKDWGRFTQENLIIRANNPNKFIVAWNNRNIHRKHPGDVVLAYKHFCDLVLKNGGDPKEDCLLLMHTQPVDSNGTDITAVVSELCSEYPVMFSDKVIPAQGLNILYNISDVVINMSSNEGFGLSTAESLSAGTPIIVNVTGGLQDQCGFINPKTEKYFTADDYVEVKTLHRKEEWSMIQHGEWVKPVWPSNISLQGSVPTPYIFDDRADFREVGQKLYEWCKTSKEERKNAGLKGREYIMNPDVGMSRKLMCERIVESVEGCLQNFTPRNHYELNLV